MAQSHREVEGLRFISVETEDGRQLCRVRSRVEYDALLETAATLYALGAVPSVMEGVEIVAEAINEEELAETRWRRSLH